MTDLLRNEEVLQRVMEERNVLHAIKRRNCLLKYIIVGKIEGRWEEVEEDVSRYCMILKKIEGIGK